MRRIHIDSMGCINVFPSDKESKAKPIRFHRPVLCIAVALIYLAFSLYMIFSYHC